MLLFRSEEHIDRWCAQRQIPRGATMTPGQCWQLAAEWYSDRRSPSFQRRTVDEAHAVFERIGLTGSFWRLA